MAGMNVAQFLRYFSSSAIRYAKPGEAGSAHLGKKHWTSLTYSKVMVSLRVCVHKQYFIISEAPFPWGDGNHGLFHNPKVNALPDGYEDEA
ncbi:unnamed protein product [Ixodes hexagonus]